MNRRILKKIRNFRAFSGLLIVSLTILSFQNCAPQNSTCTKDASGCNNESSKSSSSSGNNSNSIWDTRPGTGGASGVGIGGGGSGGGVSPGGTGGGSGSGGGIGIGGGSGGSTGGGNVGVGGGGTGTGSGGGSTDNSFRIVQQPKNVSVQEQGQFQLDVVASGGRYPFTYQWYKDNAPINDGGFGLASYPTYINTANSYTLQGTYYVVVTDADGKRVQSNVAQVTIQEPAVGCDAGSYFTYTNAQFDYSKYFAEYFDSPRGKYLLHSSYDVYGTLYSNRGYAKLSDYQVPSALAYMGKTWISCRTSIPRIHTPQTNPSAGSYADNDQYSYQGNIAFECHNKKLKLLNNTCQWVKNPNYRDDRGGN